MPRLELDELLRQLVERTEDIVATQNRLGALLDETSLVIGDLDLPTVLQRIVEAARQLVDANHGQLDVVSSEAEDLAPVLRVETDQRVGGRTTGFLDAPIRVGDDVFGSLSLIGAANGRFSTDDEEVVVALAATAGVAIDNARLYAESLRRQRWLQASMAVIRNLLSGDGDDQLALIASETRELADADIVSVVVPSSDGAKLTIEVASGMRSEELLGHSYDAESSLAGQVIASAEPIVLTDASLDRSKLYLSSFLPVGPTLMVPLGSVRRVRGVLVIGRLAGRPEFGPSDVEMASTFADHAAIAFELADARDDQQRVAVLEDRDRIARDLHDHVIQRLFAAGLTLQSISTRTHAPDGARLAAVVDEIDDTIAQIRNSIFELRGPLAATTGSLRSRVLALMNDLSRALPAEPELRMTGPLDAVIPDDAVDDILATIREALTNVARHAGATSVDVSLSAHPDVFVLDVVDDGAGLRSKARRSGLRNLEQRAAAHGGTFSVEPVHAGADMARRGTHLRWLIPLR